MPQHTLSLSPPSLSLPHPPPILSSWYLLIGTSHLFLGSTVPTYLLSFFLLSSPSFRTQPRSQMVLEDAFYSATSRYRTNFELNQVVHCCHVIKKLKFI